MTNLTQNSRLLQEKWAPVLNHEGLPEIKDQYKRAVTAVLLENQERAIQEQYAIEGNRALLTEATPTSNTGSAVDSAGLSGAATGAGARAGFDPVLISLVRRSTPQLIAYDIVGTQPMSGPTGLVFFMKSNYVEDGGTVGAEALFNAAATGHSASTSNQAVPGPDSTASKTDPFEAAYYANPDDVDTDNEDTGSDNGDNVGRNAAGETFNAMDTALAESLGNAPNQFREMSFSIERTSVTARSRALKAEYTTELVQDLKAVHGLDAEQELSNILSTEILQEINREIIRTVNGVAKEGAQSTSDKGIFDCDIDASGRWSVEKFKGLHFQLEREANAIAVATRRGRGNIIIGSADVIAALSMTGNLDTGAAEQLAADGLVNNTFVGTLNGKFKVYVDPYFTSTATNYSGGTGNLVAGATDYITVGYKGASAYDAGIFYCPYVPLQKVSAVGEQTFQPKIGFKTRYGILANPFQSLSASANEYYRIVAVKNIL